MIGVERNFQAREIAERLIGEQLSLRGNPGICSTFEY